MTSRPFDRQTALVLAATICHLIALPLPAVDNYYGEMAAGFDVRGYQCWLGLWLMPLVMPVAAPVWLALLAGNVWLILAPVAVVLRPRAGRVATIGWWMSLAAVAALAVLTIWHGAFGLRALHAGYYLWAGSLVLSALRMSTPSAPSGMGSNVVVVR